MFISFSALSLSLSLSLSPSLSLSLSLPLTHSLTQNLEGDEVDRPSLEVLKEFVSFTIHITIHFLLRYLMCFWLHPTNYPYAVKNMGVYMHMLSASTPCVIATLKPGRLGSTGCTIVCYTKMTTLLLLFTCKHHFVCTKIHVHVTCIYRFRHCD